MKKKKVFALLFLVIFIVLLLRVESFAEVGYTDKETRLIYKVVGDEITIAGVEKGITKVNIPSTIDGKTVTTIGSYAFSGRNDITNITIPNTIKCIEQFAFQDCENITEIKLPNNVVLQDYAIFKGCKSLKQIEIPCNLTSTQTFENCYNLEKVVFLNGVKKISLYNFDNCNNLKEIYIPNSVTEITLPHSFKNDNATIYVENNSYAMQICQETNIKFAVIGGQQPSQGQDQQPIQQPSQEQNQQQGQQPSQEQNQQQNQGSQEHQQSSSQQSSSKQSSNNDKTVASGILPKTGLQYEIFCIIILVLILSIIFYIKHYNLKDVK